ncbi:hypothetical protein PR202_ga14351 [Eleusine coracana subsp. coracana]|uniref:Peptidase A1 domain-containing protein n=1 Tax=Eleusine coracana subsp. coracana TaxID=191504 RepID=A0AAV5CGZ7_ELECO|nr:hypothetical protein PR202_ga14351 [Eleusine coracana subsp. coracana]
MGESKQLQLVAVIAVCVMAFLVSGGEASGIGFDLHHKSSPVVRQWAEARGHPLAGVQWPAQGTPEYYSELSRHDRAHLARRGLAGADGVVTFDSGNATIQLGELGFLYYAAVSVGTPNVTFLVALDTGSDLFWVPCDCKQCAPFENNATGITFRPYSPRQSTTSKQVTCDNPLCDRPNACTNSSSSCPYTVQYVSANTSSSGVLVQDIVHLAREGSSSSSAVQAPIVFGCGQTQTGLFLTAGGSPDGLLGLGMDKVSLPSVLAAKGLIASNSFSMCFSEDGVGRINFGDVGSPGQAETPFIVSSFHPTYNVSFTSINVGTESTPVKFTAIMDSGTSFTYLNEPEYSAIATNFNSQVSEKRTNFTTGSGGSLPFEYCYALSRGQTGVAFPQVSLTTNNKNGGAQFPVLQPILPLYAQTNDGKVRPLGYCLAILRNDITINIIGQNFMTGLKVVFDRERNVLGWQEFDCYKNVVTTAADGPAGSPRAAAPAPTTTTTLNPHDNNGNNSSFPAAAPVPRSPSSANAASKLHRGLPLLLLLLLPLLVMAALA